MGSEILLYSERCIVQKLLAGAASMGIHRVPRPSMPQQQPVYAFLEASRAFQTGLVGSKHCDKLLEGVRRFGTGFNWPLESF